VEGAGGCGSLHDDEIYNVYTVLNIVRVMSSRMRWAGHVSLVGVMRNEYKETIWKTRRRWGNNIRMDLRERGWGGVDWLRIETGGGLL
jgi:hypothetical protein